MSVFSLYNRKNSQYVKNKRNVMKNIILSTLVTLSLIQSVNASQLLEYRCVIDYTQEIMHEQAKYIQRETYTTPFDFNELGIEVASNKDPYYQEGFFILMNH